MPQPNQSILYSLYSCLLLLVLVVITSSFDGKSQNQLKTGYYYLAQTESEGILINDIDSEDVFAVEKQAAIDVNDFIDASIVVRNYKPNPIKFIEIKVTKEGKQKWANIKKRISTTGESIVFIGDNKIYSEVQKQGNDKKFDATIDLPVSEKHLYFVLTNINAEIKNSK